MDNNNCVICTDINSIIKICASLNESLESRDFLKIKDTVTLLYLTNPWMSEPVHYTFSDDPKDGDILRTVISDEYISDLIEITKKMIQMYIKDTVSSYDNQVAYSLLNNIVDYSYLIYDIAKELGYST